MRKRDSIPPIVSLNFIVYCISLSERGHRSSSHWTNSSFIIPSNGAGSHSSPWSASYDVSIYHLSGISSSVPFIVELSTLKFNVHQLSQSSRTPLQQPLDEIVLYYPQQWSWLAQQPVERSIRFERFILRRRFPHQLLRHGIVDHHILVSDHAKERDIHFAKRLLYLGRELYARYCGLWTYYEERMRKTITYEARGDSSIGSEIRQTFSPQFPLVGERVSLAFRPSIRISILKFRARRRGGDDRQKRRDRVQPPKCRPRDGPDIQRQHGG